MPTLCLPGLLGRANEQSSHYENLRLLQAKKHSAGIIVPPPPGLVNAVGSWEGPEFVNAVGSWEAARFADAVYS